MISRKHECIFIHIPKTGGQSIESVFVALNGLEWSERGPLVLRFNPDPAKGPERLAHLKANEYVRYDYIDQPDFDRYFKFAFVRNPWARLVSEYRYLKLEGQRTFREFVEESFATSDDYLNKARHIVPQADFVTDGRGEIIVDFIGRFETIHEDFRHVADKLGLGDMTLPHRNSSSPGGRLSSLRKLLSVYLRPSGTKRQSYQSFYDDDLRERVGEYYAKDVEMFGYGFDGPLPIRQRDE